MPAPRATALLAALAVAGLSGCTRPGPTRIDAPFVPTPMTTVERMLEMAQPGPDDVLYDLGSGDGRIAILAVQRYGVKKAVGIDIDPELVRESTANALKAGVADRVRFRQGDVFEVDFSEATVVTIYLLQHLNIELRPRLLNELKPGTRIISYEFHLGTWVPDQSWPEDRTPPLLVDTTDEDTPRVYSWIVPANVNGRWRMTAGDDTLALDLRQTFQQVDGAIEAFGTAAAIRDGRLVGDRLRFRAQAVRGGRPVPVAFDGRVSGDAIDGALVIDGRRMPAVARRLR